MPWKDTVVLVTGGGTGIGRAISLRFAAAGAAVIINYSVSRQDAENTADEIRNHGGAAEVWQADVRRDAETRSMVAEIGGQWGRLDVLVNNAGWSQRVPHADLEALTDEIWDRTLDVNLRGAFYMTRAAVPLLRKSRNASIVNIASAAGLHAAGSSVVYAASKAALLCMTKSLARALAPAIRVNAVCPGLVKTRFASWPEEAFEVTAEVSPLKRLVTVEEVAEAAMFAAGCAGMTGEEIVMDGGIFHLGRSR